MKPSCIPRATSPSESVPPSASKRSLLAVERLYCDLGEPEASVISGSVGESTLGNTAAHSIVSECKRVFSGIARKK